MGCTHNCSSCSSNCSSKGSENRESFIAEANKLSNIKKVIGVVSGKGGVGKSLVTSLLACEMQKRGHQCAVLDADITGPSIPKSFGIHEKAMGTEDGIIPAKTDTGINIMSVNLMLENETDPVIWRGPVIAGVVKQFWTDVVWGDVDYMFVDMPPGTGDVPLTVFQSLPVDGIVIVSSPQDLVSMIVEKAVKMAQAMNIPVVGLAENMAYFVCPDCNKKHYIFGKNSAEEIAEKFDISAWSELPINPEMAEKVDNGLVEEVDSSIIKELADKIEAL